MKKYKIGNKIITADSVIKAVKIAKVFDSIKDEYFKYRGANIYKHPSKELYMIEGFGESYSSLQEAKKAVDNDIKNGIRFDSIKDNEEIDYLTKEEEQAVEDYRKAIAGTTNPKLLELYKHILDEELEHIRELEQANNNVEDCDMKDDRLSPMTYKKLKELGVSNKEWAEWTQEQANEYIRNKSRKKSKEKSFEEKKEENNQTKLSSVLTGKNDKKAKIELAKALNLSEDNIRRYSDDKDIIYYLPVRSKDDIEKLQRSFEETGVSGQFKIEHLVGNQYSAKIFMKPSSEKQSSTKMHQSLTKQLNNVENEDELDEIRRSTEKALKNKDISKDEYEDVIDKINITKKDLFSI